PVSTPEPAPANGAGNGAGNGTGNGAPNGIASRARGSAPNGTHAGLPRRVRQANIAPQLRTPSTQPPLSAPPMEERSPEEARAVFAAFQSGARRGREDSDQPGGVAPGDHAHNTHGEKGDA
ncbi:histidine kinase, partial [Microbispora triticiradicis]|nr:histidine kinase [Microbispora triticiradicis]